MKYKIINEEISLDYGICSRKFSVIRPKFKFNNNEWYRQLKVRLSEVYDNSIAVEIILSWGDYKCNSINVLLLSDESNISFLDKYHALKFKKL